MDDPLTPQARVELTREVLEILRTWEVPAAEQPALLGLPEDTAARALNRYRLSGSLPEEPGVYERIALLLEIDHALHQFFPHNPSAGRFWITTPRPRFGGITPLKIMLDKGLDGMHLLVDALYNRTGF
jgi:hypothetical protein